ncbi:MAG: undecaprenyl-phosphate glucose phosphotransferase [Bacteroidia bacterium]
MKSSKFLFKTFVIITEAILLNLCVKYAFYLRFDRFENQDIAYSALSLIFVLAWILASLFNNSYDSRRLQRFMPFLKGLVSTLFIHLFIITFYIVSFKEAIISRNFLFYSYILGILTLIGFRGILIIGYNYYNNVTYNIRKIAVVGSDSSISDVFHHFDSKNTTVYRFLEHIDPKINQIEKDKLVRETVEELKAFCLREQVNEIYLSISLASEELIEEMAHFADTNFIYFRLVTSFDVFGKRSVNVEYLGHIPILGLRKEPLKILINRMIKRAFDIVFSSLVIILIFPILFPIIAILIKLESKGPVIFKQLRTGKSRKEFWVYKFRTMTINQDSDRLQAVKGDQRITRIGALMRKMSIDEMPQFFNVLLGHMSVVGPRPHMLVHTEEYSQIIDKYLFRHFITPGITGHAQVHGLRGGTMDPDLMKKRVEYDSWYIENWSLILDIKIILITLWKVTHTEDKAY